MEKFHTLRHLAAGLSIEAAELLETMLWQTDDEVVAKLHDPAAKLAIQREVADVLIYALLICHTAGIDPEHAVQEKLAENARKYPVALARGNATKYTDLSKHPRK